MTPTLKPEEAEALCDLLRAEGWLFMGQVGTHRYWRTPSGNGWRAEEEAFVLIRKLYQVPEAAG